MRIIKVKKGGAIISKYLVKKDSFLPKLRDKLLKENEIGFDTETSSISREDDVGLRVRGENKDLVVVSIIISTRDDSYYLPLNHYFYNNNLSEEKIRECLYPIFDNEGIKLVAHNFSFDRHVLERIGIEINHSNYFDTLIASRMIPSGSSNKLEKIIDKYFGIDNLTEFDDVVATVSSEKKKKVGLSPQSKAGIDLVNVKYACKYGIEDTKYLLSLKDKMIEELKKYNQFEMYKKFMVPEFTNILFNMEKTGIDVNKNRMREMGKRMQEEIDKMKERMLELSGIEINYNSNIQLSELLYGEYYSDSPCENCDECMYTEFLAASENKEDIKKEMCNDYRTWNKYGHKNPNIEIREKTFGFPIPEYTDKENPSTSKDALKRFVHYKPKNKRQENGLEFINIFLDYRKLSKLKSTFIDGLMNEIYDDNKAHPSINCLAAKSGRLSSAHPNSQQLPDQDEDDNYKIRSLFVPSSDDKVIVASDYDGLEMRILANFSEDEFMLDKFQGEFDVHGSTAKKMFPSINCHPNEVKKKYPKKRMIGKIIGFMLMYGAYYKTLYYSLMNAGVDLEDRELQRELNAYSGMDLAKQLKNSYFETYSGVDEFIDEQQEKVRKTEVVESILGRKIDCSIINSSDSAKRSYGERFAINGKIQSSAADIMMCGQINVKNNKELSKMGVRQLLQVHDELVLEVPKNHLDEAIKLIKKEMENPLPDYVKTSVNFTVSQDYGESYFEAK